MGMAEPGEEYMLNCTVTVVDRLIVSPVITWTKRSANNDISVPPVLMSVSNVMSSLYLRFTSLNTSDAGLYICEASINVSQISIVARNNDTSNLPLESKYTMIDMIPINISLLYYTVLVYCNTMYLIMLSFLHYNVLHLDTHLLL